MKRYKPRPVRSLLARFWEKVDRSGNCWTWNGTHVPAGYGRMCLGRRGDGWEYAHRISYRLHLGDPTGYVVAHHCDNPQCVNPDHLFLTTHAGNIADKMQKGRARGRYSKPTTLLHTKVA